MQLATGRKVALKLLHPEMTKDENLVARFRREGMVLCNLRDAHTITTYDFDQTPDGTLYIAMELLEGKSLHQVFHEQAPLEWKRMFKILIEMCSSLAEAHAQGIVHRDLKPENVYLETRPGQSRVREDPRLRHREGDARRFDRSAVAAAHGDRPDARHARVHVARAADGQAARRAQRCLRARRRRVRDDHRRACRSPTRRARRA